MMRSSCEVVWSSQESVEAAELNARKEKTKCPGLGYCSIYDILQSIRSQLQSMGSFGSWILSKVNLLRHKLVGSPEIEHSHPSPWSLESPFQKWTIYSKVSLAAAATCFIIFIILHSRRQSAVPKKMMVIRTLIVPQISDSVLSESCILDTWLYHFALFLILCLFISVPWEWVRLYQIEVAKKATILSEGYARSCYQQDRSFWENLKIWLSWNFSWDSDSCESYYKALMVDPLWEVTPLMNYTYQPSSSTFISTAATVVLCWVTCGIAPLFEVPCKSMRVRSRLS
ncbi:uncharacterized protein [Dendrobates tinctorius]|uniref:uncharacterized protein isoform X2 n=1 Tax=Dendrobates tinctorius TaxID=92724 RepID=UPI003CC9D80F